MLTPEGCRVRQERFLSRLEKAGIAGALISEPRDIYYFTGVLPEQKMQPYPSVLFLGPGLPSWLLTGLAGAEPLVDEVVVYPIGVYATLNPDNHRRLCELLPDLAQRHPNPAKVGYQAEGLPHSVARAFALGAAPGRWEAIDPLLQDLQLRKDPDEVACIRRAIRATLAGYTRAQQVIRPGVSELEVMTECQAAAQRYSGEVHFYNGDFRSGEPGGIARNRTIDAWSDVGGYWCDMSRAWAVSGEPSHLQAGVYEHLADILRAVPEMARLGRSTTEFWQELDARVREHPHLAEKGLAHHGGHGIGLRVHEGPDLNRDRGGVFEVGNVFTCEPGAYSAELNQGARLENLFLVTPTGVEILSEYPLSPVPDPACSLP